MYSTVIKRFIKKIPYLNKYAIKLSKYKKIITFKKSIRNNEKINLVIGASGIYEPHWIPSDIEYFDILKSSDWKHFFHFNMIDVILSEHVWEHLTLDEGERAAANCYQYLKKDAYLRIAVPDGYHPNKDYINTVKIGGSGAGSDDHKVLYNYKNLSAILQKIGFQIELLEYFDENGKFHQNNWDTSRGMIHRSADNDNRNFINKLTYTSIIIDAKKT